MKKVYTRCHGHGSPGIEPSEHTTPSDASSSPCLTSCLLLAFIHPYCHTVKLPLVAPQILTTLRPKTRGSCPGHRPTPQMHAASKNLIGPRRTRRCTAHFWSRTHLRWKGFTIYGALIRTLLCFYFVLDFPLVSILHLTLLLQHLFPLSSSPPNRIRLRFRFPSLPPSLLNSPVAYLYTTPLTWPRPRKEKYRTIVAHFLIPLC